MCLEGAVIVLACIIFSLFASTPPVVDVNATYTDGENTYLGRDLDEKGLLVPIKGTMSMKRIVLKKI